MTSTEPTPLHRTSRKKKSDSSSSDNDDNEDSDIEGKIVDLIAKCLI